MIIGIHQSGYFPWMGYFDKMAKSDLFILLDEVQLSDNSEMFRNVFLNKAGQKKYLTICYDKKDYMSKKNCEIHTNKNIKWQTDHKNFIVDTYKKSPFFNEIWDKILFIFEKEYDFAYDSSVDTVNVISNMLNIQTKIIRQSEIQYDRSLKKNELVLELCKKNKATVYLSGNGARSYMNVEDFNKCGIEVEYQKFEYPIYKQMNTSDFVPNLSIIDIFFNCGIEKTKNIFWENIKKNEQVRKVL